jgi:hypothetical protein
MVLTRRSLVGVALLAAIVAAVNGPSETDKCLYDSKNDANGDGICDDCFKECSGSYAYLDTINNTCYFLVTEQDTMANAEKYCQTHGLNVHIAFPPTLTLFNALHQVVKNIFGACPTPATNPDVNCAWWLGLNDVDSTCSFPPIDGSARTYSMWTTGEPNSCSTSSSAANGTCRVGPHGGSLGLCLRRSAVLSEAACF